MKHLFSVFVIFSTLSLNAQTILSSKDDGCFAGRMVGENIVFNFNFVDSVSYSTFFFEKDGKNIFLDGEKIGDSLILHTVGAPDLEGTFRLRMVSNNTSAIGQWESNGEVRDVTVHKTDIKELTQNLNKKIADAIVAFDPHFIFRNSDIMKLNMLSMHSSEIGGVEWATEKISGVAFPRSPYKTLNKKLEGMHYLYALKSLNSFGTVEYKTTIVENSTDLLSLNIVVNDSVLGKPRNYEMNPLLDVKSGNSYVLSDILKFKEKDTEFATSTDLGVLNLLKSNFPDELSLANGCAWAELVEMGGYSWSFGQNGITIRINSQKNECSKSFLLPFRLLKNVKNK